jgi:hypothetical protein
MQVPTGTAIMGQTMCFCLPKDSVLGELRRKEEGGRGGGPLLRSAMGQLCPSLLLSFLLPTYSHFRSSRMAMDFGPRWEMKQSIFFTANGQTDTYEYTAHKDISFPPDLRIYIERPVWVRPEWESIVVSAYFMSTACTDERRRCGGGVRRRGGGGGERHLQLCKFVFHGVIVSPFSLQDPARKKVLGFFGGQVVSSKVSDHRGSNYSLGVRQYFDSVLRDKEPDFQIQMGARSHTYEKDITGSKFCLCPEGWHAWTPRPYEAVLLGCVPVIVSDRIDLALTDIIDWSRVVVHIPIARTHDIPRILRGISDEAIWEKLEAGRRIWPLISHHRKWGGVAQEAMLDALSLRKRRQKNTVL